MCDLAEKLGKITDSEEKFNAGIKLIGLLGMNNMQLAWLEDLNDVIIADESLQQEISKHCKFPLDAAPAIISDRLQNLTASYVHASLLTLKDTLDDYIQEKTEQTV
jgi:hypothetical protein